MNVGYIYITTNDINENIYIGKRQKPTFEKWYKGSGTHLKSAFKRYGKSHFHASVLEWCDSKESLCSAERRWISYFREQGFDMYNITCGGDGGFPSWKTYPKEKQEEMLRKNSEAHKGERNPFFGKKHTQETKRLISEHNVCRYPVELMEYKERQREMLPKIVQIDKKTHSVIAVWSNWCEASKSVSPNNRCGYAHIGEVCDHKRKSAYGFIWEYAEGARTI